MPYAGDRCPSGTFECSCIQPDLPDGLRSVPFTLYTPAAGDGSVNGLEPGVQLLAPLQL